ncbi:hypothetical protein AB0368_26915 [Actinoplanes sp. NPDC051475]|uniref:hypothetical protein n=1 Tax=Actinoplanes sp. NPDC051475 TaxID=3157225 RepID=UPI00344CD00B
MKHRRRELPDGRRLLRLLAAGTALTVLAAAAAVAVNRAFVADLGVVITRPMQLSLTFTRRVQAAEPVTVAVGGAPPGAAVSLISVGSIGAVTADAVAGRNGATFELSDDTTRWAGTVTLIARSGNSVTSATLTVAPGPVVGPALAAVGPRSIVADGTDRSMVVTVPTDRFGNAAPDGTQVDVIRGRAGAGERRTELRMDGLLAHGLLQSGTEAATGEVRVGVGAVSGPTVSLDEVAGPPKPFTLQVTGAVPDADGRSLLTVATAVLTDRFGNVQPDGTEVNLRWNEASGGSEADGYTVRGVAQFAIEAPGQAATLALRATCRGTATARPLNVRFRAVQPTIALTARRNPKGIGVVVGPVRGSLGALVADGTPAAVSVIDPKGHKARGSGQLVEGMLRLELPDDALSGVLSVRATVLGRTERVTLR